MSGDKSGGNLSFSIFSRFRREIEQSPSKALCRRLKPKLFADNNVLGDLQIYQNHFPNNIKVSSMSDTDAMDCLATCILHNVNIFAKMAKFICLNCKAYLSKSRGWCKDLISAQ